MPFLPIKFFLVNSHYISFIQKRCGLDLSSTIRSIQPAACDLSEKSTDCVRSTFHHSECRYAFKLNLGEVREELGRWRLPPSRLEGGPMQQRHQTRPNLR